MTSKKSVFSSLAFQLEEDDSRLENPFADYSRHDGEVERITRLYLRHK